MIRTITVIAYVVVKHKTYANVRLFVITGNVYNDSLVQEHDLAIATHIIIVM